MIAVQLVHLLLLAGQVLPGSRVALIRVCVSLGAP